MSKSEYNFSNTFSGTGVEIAILANKRQPLFQNQLLMHSTPILLLTPSPPFFSLLQVATHYHHHYHGAAAPLSKSNSAHVGFQPTTAAAATTIGPTPAVMAMIKSQNIVIESAILFLRAFKRIVKLLLNSIESNYSSAMLIHTYNNLLISSATHLSSPTPSPSPMLLVNSPRLRSCSPLSEVSGKHNHYNANHHHHHHHEHPHHHNHHHHSHKKDSLDSLLDKLTTQPKSLKVLSRRLVLNSLVSIQKRRRDDNTEDKIALIKNQVLQLPLPKRLQNYLLFNN